MMGGCASSGPTRAETYVVRPQDTLYSIAWRHNLDYRELAKWNNIGSDYRLRAGEVLTLQPGGRASAPPGQDVLPDRAMPPNRPVPPNHSAPSNHPAPPFSASTKPVESVNGVNPREPPIAVGMAAGSPWIWPTDRSSAPRPVPGGGVLLLGRLGQDVRAARAGRVVYTGSGLRGYGNLIIIKHGDAVLTSYAHNRELLVHEGQDVAAGQTIAHMGTGPHQISALYFEIRVNGKPIDPLGYLPARSP